MKNWKDWKFKAETSLWTGDFQERNERIIPTGIMGSIRWWFEVLVRGLDGKACDPTYKEIRCPTRKKPTESGHHCVVCELFGCTGWARKFRLMIINDTGEVIQRQIHEGQTFTLRFIPLRQIYDEEWCLLDATLQLISKCGAIGGKTVFKPSEERSRENAFHHRDFGLIEYVEGPSDWRCEKTLSEIKAYIQDSRWRQDIPQDSRQYDYSWASLKNFWCVKGRYLARESFNQSSYNHVLGRNMRKDQSQNLWQNTPINRWLAGRQQESKKVFSFKDPEKARRTFGFVKPGLVDFEEMKQRLSQVWSDFNPDEEFFTSGQILEQLFSLEESA